MQTDTLQFDGRGPIYLRAVESANATALENTIQLTLYAVSEVQGRIRIETQMTPRTAQELANRLLRAAKDANESGPGF